MKWKVVSLIVLMALVTLGIAVPMAQASGVTEPAAKGGVFVVGTVLQVTSHEVTLQTPDGEWQIALSDETEIRLPGVPKATWEDIEVGKALLVRGVVTAPGAMQATQIGAPPRPQQPFEQLLEALKRARRLDGSLKGEIVAVDVPQSSFTLRVGEDEVSVTVDEETQYRIPDVAEPSLADLQVGQLAVVQVSPKTETARAVAVVTERQMQRILAEHRLFHAVRRIVGQQGIRGQISEIGEDYVLISTPRGEARINVSDETRFQDAERQEISFEDLEVGQSILVMGLPEISCPIDAKSIWQLPPAPATAE